MSKDDFQIMVFWLLMISLLFIVNYYPRKAYREAKNNGYKGSYWLFCYTVYSMGLEEDRSIVFSRMPRRHKIILGVLVVFAAICLFV